MLTVKSKPQGNVSSAQNHRDRRVHAALVLGALTVLGILTWQVFSRTVPERQSSVANVASVGFPSTVAAPTARGAGADTTGSARTPEAFAHWLANDSSLRGAELDGAWGFDATGSLLPSRALRRRFDQLLTLQGERGLDEIKRYISAEVEREHGAAAAQAVMERFNAYLTLLGTTYRTNPNSADRELLAAALAERHASRQQILGKVWADAFYAEEEAAMRAFIDSAPVGAATSGAAAVSSDPAAAVIGPSGLDDQALDFSARERLAAERASWQAWEARLQAARDALARLRKAPELSEIQRDAAVDAWIAAHFEGSELRRARALLLPPR